MKNLFGFLLLLLSIGSFAQPNSTYPQLPYTEFMSVDIIDDYVIARGSCDQIWSSSDGGDSWSYDEVEDQKLANVSLIPADPSKAVIILGEEIVIYDLGNQEIINSSKDSPLELRWGKLTMAKESDIYLLTIEGLFRATLNEYEWELVFERPLESANFDVADITDDYIFIGTSDGKIYRYNIADMSTSLRSDNESKISELAMGTNDIGYVIGGASTAVQKTVDGGVSFNPVNSLPINRNIHALGANTVATILGFRMDVSLDGGLTAEQYQMSNTINFGDIDNGFISEDGTIYAYGKGSCIAKTSDYGETFQFVNPYDRSDFRDVNIYDDGYGLACGEFSTIVATIDHGHSWSPVDFGIPENQTLQSIDRMSNGQIIIGGYEGIHVVENDQVIHTTNAQCNDILVTNDGNLLAHINNEGIYQIIRSADNGMTWQVVQNGVSFTSHIRQGSDGRIYVATQSQDVYLSDDDGMTWMVGDLGLAFQNIYPFNEDVIMGTLNNDLYRSQDGGGTWSAIYSAYLIDNVTYTSATSFFFTYAQNGETRLMFTDDAGNNWQEKYQNCSMTNAIAINKEEEVVMAQSTGHINIYPPLNSTSLEEAEKVDSWNLRIWPNPLEKNTLLQIGSDWSDLQIIDLEGRVVLRYDAQRSEIDVSHLESGLYIVQAIHAGVMKSEKLILF